jgi:hypothetical protein
MACVVWMKDSLHNEGRARSTQQRADQHAKRIGKNALQELAEVRADANSNRLSSHIDLIVEMAWG